MTEIEVSKKAAKNTVASRKSGKDTYKKILKCAYELIASGSYQSFSMRNVAKNAELRLANVQYYFPTKESLIKALIEHVRIMYDEQYAQLLDSHSGDAVDTFHRMIDFCLNDVFEKKTRHLFIQLWTLLSEADGDSGEFLANLYSFQIESIAKIVRQLCPEISNRESIIRGEAIASMIEGLIVVKLNANESKVDQDALKKAFRVYALNLAKADSTM